MEPQDPRTPDEARANILVVDDKPEKTLALAAILEGLGQNMVRAHSGREALRALLHQDFAVVLLDINMPGMDGFETAALIRQRRSLEHIPIIFITAYDDEVRVQRGYSLGAVDYITAPVVPDILRTKVAVFVDLAKMTAQTRRQAQWLEQRAAQLDQLNNASLTIHGAATIEDLLRVVADTARGLVGAHQAYATADAAQPHPGAAASFSDLHQAWRGRGDGRDKAALAELTPLVGRSLRLDTDELSRHPAYAMLAPRLGRPPLRGWLGAALTGRDGRHMGLIEVSDKLGGDFTRGDEAVIVQLAQMASLAIENVLFAQAREANRLKDEFLATLSHELRTPLNAIVGWTALLRGQPPEAQKLAKGLDVIERNVRAQTRLIEDLLDVSRINAGKARLSLRATSLRAVVAAAVDAVRPAADAKRIVLTFEATLLNGEDHLQGDPDRLQQVVTNLLTNAVKFTPKGGRVETRLEHADGKLRITVADNGMGITPEFLPHVFECFRQGDSSSTRSHGGLGLGLTLVRHFVGLHGGEVGVASEGPGRGSVFTVTIPAGGAGQGAGGTGPTTRDRSEQSVRVGGDGGQNLRGLRVLVVDDEPDGRELAAQAFTGGLAEVTTAASVEEALREFDRWVPDVLVSDLAMPGQDGYALIGSIRGRPAHLGGDVPALALTAYAREEDRQRCLAAGFQAHAAKPVDPAVLVAMVAQLLGRGSPARSRAQRP